MIGTPLSTLHLESSEFCITRIGFGSWAVDGSSWSFGWGAEDGGDSIATIRHAPDLGVGWIDTGAMEAGAESSDCSSHNRAYVFAKCGLIFEEGPRAGEPKHTRWPASIRQECESSLRRLGVERVDLYELDSAYATQTRVDEELPATMSRLAAHRIGLAWYSPAQVDLMMETMSQANRLASAVVVAWTLTSPGVAGAIVGAGSAEKIEGWIDAATLVLSRANMGEIVTAIGRTGTGNRPQLPAVLAA
jgi:aryl-alcohol dehydrogenase-like predicted oxidoreductase